MAKKKTLYAYAMGSEMDGEATVHSDTLVAAVEKRLDALVSTRKWASKDVWVVNQREAPHWDLGLNLVVPAARASIDGFADDVVAVASELATLKRETGSSFVIGIHDAAADETKDLFVIDSDQPDLDRLRQVVRA